MLKRIKYLLLALLIVLTTGLLAISRCGREKLLFNSATKIMPLSESDDYYWLGNQEIMVRRVDYSKFSLFPYQHVIDLIRYHLTGKTEKHMSAVAKAYNSTKDHSVWMSVSPNGHWIMWADGSDNIYASSVDGSQRYSWYSDSNTPPYWTNDSQYCIEFSWGQNPNSLNYQRNTAIIHDIKDHNATQTLPIAPLSLDSSASPVPISLQQVFTVTSENDHLFLTESNLLQHGQIINRSPIHISSGETVESMAFARYGRKIAWILEYRQSQSPFASLRRLIPILAFKPTYLIGLWTSSTDGSHMREIGHFYIDSGKHFNVVEFNLQWSPDGKFLTFVYRNALWVITPK